MPDVFNWLYSVKNFMRLYIRLLSKELKRYAITVTRLYLLICKYVDTDNSELIEFHSNRLKLQTEVPCRINYIMNIKFEANELWTITYRLWAIVSRRCKILNLLKFYHSIQYSGYSLRNLIIKFIKNWYVNVYNLVDGKAEFWWNVSRTSLVNLKSTICPIMNVSQRNLRIKQRL